MAPQLDQPSPGIRSELSRPSNDRDHGSLPLRFPSLPPEIHLRIISYLDYREVQFLRATSSYFYNLLSGADLARFRDTYAESLYQEELESVESPLTADYLTTSDNSDISYEAKKRSAQYLTCYTCFRTRHISHFASTQCTQRRRKGHIHAKKRFCEDCGVEKGKWQPGTELQFVFPFSMRVYCLRCREVRPTPVGHGYRMQTHHYGICQGCLAELEEYYSHDQIDRIVADLEREKKGKDSIKGI